MRKNFSIYTDFAFNADLGGISKATDAVTSFGKRIASLGLGLKSLPKSPFLALFGGLKQAFGAPLVPSKSRDKPASGQTIVKKVIEKTSKTVSPGAILPASTRPVAQVAGSVAQNALGIGALGAVLSRAMSPLVLILSTLGISMGAIAKSFGWAQGKAEERQKERIDAQRLGVSVPSMIGLETAAEKSGVSDGKTAISQALGALQAMKEGLRLGQPSQSAHILSARGIPLYDANKKEKSNQDLLLDALREVKAAPRQNQSLILKQILGSDDLLPLLDRPDKDIRKDLTQAQKSFETREKQASLFESVADVKTKGEALSRQLDAVGERVNTVQSGILSKASQFLNKLVKFSQSLKSSSLEASPKAFQNGLKSTQNPILQKADKPTRERPSLSPRQVPISERPKPEKKSVIEIAFKGLPSGTTAGVKTETEGVRLNLGSMLEEVLT